MFLIQPPQDRNQILAELSRLSDELVGFLDGFTDEAFFAPQGDKWSPAGHVRHLTKSVRAVADAMRKPKVLLLVFGLARSPARSFEEIVTAYQQILDRGGLGGRVAPPRVVTERPRIKAGGAVGGRGGRRAAARWWGWGHGPVPGPPPRVGEQTGGGMGVLKL
jgi:hypothetical protein